MGVEQGGDYFGGGGYSEPALTNGNGGGGYDYYPGGDEFAIDYIDLYGGPIDYAPYDPNAPENQLTEPNYEPLPESPGSANLFEDYLDYYIELGYDPLSAADLAATDASVPAYQLQGEGLLPLPDVSLPNTFIPPPALPWIPTPTPVVSAPPAPAAPQLPPSPAAAQPNLPPACPQGQYHPYPIGHPQQNVCVAFPPVPPPQQPRPSEQPEPRPSSGSGGSAKPQPKPRSQTQPQCPTGYYQSASGCVPIPKCTTPGTVFDQRTGRCVPASQAQDPGCPTGYTLNRATGQCEPNPLCQPPLVFDPEKGMCAQPSEAEESDVFGSLKNIPWWIWAALAGFLLLSQGEEKKKVTIQHRRAN